MPYYWNADIFLCLERIWLKLSDNLIHAYSLQGFEKIM